MQEDRLFILSDAAMHHSEVDAWLGELNAELAALDLPLANLSRMKDGIWAPRLDKDARGMIVVPGANQSSDTALSAATRAAMEQANRHDLPIVVVCDQPTSRISAGMHRMTVLPSKTSPQTMGSILFGMLARQEKIDELRMQNEINGRIIENVTDEIDLIDEELQSAMLVQKALLPRKMPSSQKVSMAAFWRPSSYVSGDFYQARMLDQTRMGVLLADAAGHGVASALMTMIMAKSFEPHSDDGEILAPGEVMRKINDALCQIERSRSRFATAIYVVIDCEDGSLSYSTAGHPPPMILAKDRVTALDLEHGGAGLGIFDDSEFETMSGRLEAGESLLIYSDGFEQAFPMPDAPEDALHMPNNAYLNVFKSLAGLGDPEAMIGRLESAIDARRGSLRQKDDLTLLCVHHAGGPSQIEVARQQMTFPSAGGLS